MRRGGPLLLLASLYIAQGLPYGFFTQTIPVLMRQERISLGAIGLAQLLAIPWALKFLWAPLVDRHGSARFGRRRSWILPLQALSIATVLLASLFDPRNGFAPVLALVLAANLFAASQDIATDAMAIDLLPPAARGLGNGVQVAGYRVGMILGGGTLLVVYDAIGWRGATQLLALALLLVSIPVVLHREQPLGAPAPVSPRASGGRDAWSWLALPGAGAWLAVLLVYKTGDAFASGMLKAFLVDGGVDLAGIGKVLGYVGFAAGLLGAIAGGVLVNPLGRRRAILLFGLAQAVSVAAYATLAGGVSTTGAPPDAPFFTLTNLYAVSAFEHFTGGMATAALFTAMMDAARPTHAAADYTLQASAVVIATGAAQSTSGFLAEPLGYGRFFLLSAALSAAGTILVAVLWRRTIAASPRREGAV